MILQCPRCLNVITWERETNPKGPGTCSCKTFQDWKVLKEYPEKGFVRLLTDKGWQELKPPYYKDKK